jgi:hypothetical protein
MAQIENRRPMEQGDVVGKPEFEVLQLQILVADRGSRGWRAQPRTLDPRAMPAACATGIGVRRAGPRPALPGLGDHEAG